MHGLIDHSPDWLNLELGRRPLWSLLHAGGGGNGSGAARAGARVEREGEGRELPCEFDGRISILCASTPAR